MKLIVKWAPLWGLAAKLAWSLEMYRLLRDRGIGPTQLMRLKKKSLALVLNCIHNWKEQKESFSRNKEVRKKIFRRVAGPASCPLVRRCRCLPLLTGVVSINTFLLSSHATCKYATCPEGPGGGGGGGGSEVRGEARRIDGKKASLEVFSSLCRSCPRPLSLVKNQNLRAFRRIPHGRGEKTDGGRRRHECRKRARAEMETGKVAERRRLILYLFAALPRLCCT